MRCLKNAHIHFFFFIVTQEVHAVKRLTSSEIRYAFTQFFKKRGHGQVQSSSLVPSNDPTLLFTNAGMVQFKEIFQGQKAPESVRACSVQRCVRAGGKHNDLENVGYTARHHTFFEMLGNFSFGDYFKKEAIAYAWEFLTKELGIPEEKLWVTVHKDDHDAASIWLDEMKVDPARFTRCGDADNFWQMGDVGPCGPCSEIFYDHGSSVDGGPPGTPNQEGDRYVEVWNMVFMQYNRSADGALTPLPKPSIDTGMGLERLAAVLQGVQDNYDIELFQYILNEQCKIMGVDDKANKSMRVLADHIRSTVFLIADGVTPSNEGRGYVLRRIIRRAVRHGYKLGQSQPFFYRFVAAVVVMMVDDYPHLLSSQAMIEKVIMNEEEQFFRTLMNGIRILETALNQLSMGDDIAGDTIFQLYDTYGFPADLTADIARERGFGMDMKGFQACMSRQRQLSQRNQSFNLNQTQQLHINGRSEFVGYDMLSVETHVTGLLQDDKPVNALTADQEGIVMLERTPFYAESGGQVGDKGYLYFQSGCFRVQNTMKLGDNILHYGKVIKGRVEMDDTISAEVDKMRKDIALNHSATHLLHEALRRVLGDHVQQRGSLVDERRLRFDFSHPNVLTPQEVNAVERLVNQQIRANHPAVVEEMSLEDAKKKSAMALFGENYGKVVRVLSLGDFSIELCGGTHVAATGDIGFFKIITETACASGIRRIEAVTGEAAIAYVESQDRLLDDLAINLKTSPKNLPLRLTQLVNEHKAASKELTRLRQKMAGFEVDAYMNDAADVAGLTVIAKQCDNVGKDGLRDMLDRLKQKAKHAVIVLAYAAEDKVTCIAGVTKPDTDKINASDLVKFVSAELGGRGGGRPDLAQGGGDQPDKLPAVLANVSTWVAQQLEQVKT